MMAKPDRRLEADHEAALGITADEADELAATTATAVIDHLQNAWEVVSAYHGAVSRSSMAAAVAKIVKAMLQRIVVTAPANPAVRAALSRGFVTVTPPQGGVGATHAL